VTRALAILLRPCRATSPCIAPGFSSIRPMQCKRRRLGGRQRAGARAAAAPTLGRYTPADALRTRIRRYRSCHRLPSIAQMMSGGCCGSVGRVVLEATGGSNPPSPLELSAALVPELVGVLGPRTAVAKIYHRTSPWPNRHPAVQRLELLSLDQPVSVRSPDARAVRYAPDGRRQSSSTR
jgi:hypothetical protein